MAIAHLPPAHVVRQLLDYDTKSGKLFWRQRDVSWFGGKNPEKSAKTWNARFAGKEAFTAPHNNGYRVGAILGVKVYGHQVVWCWHNGSWPTLDIDHGDWDRANNKIENLSEMTHSRNCMNWATRPIASSGYRYVRWDKTRRQWTVSVKVDGQYRWIGRFDLLEQAIEKRDAFLSENLPKRAKLVAEASAR